MYPRVLIIAVCLAALVSGGLAYRWMGSEEPEKVNARLDDVWFNDLYGRKQSFSQWADKILVVNFWATWCPPCKEEMPEFSRAQSDWGRRGVQFVGIAVDDPKDVRAYLAANPVTYPILDGERGGPEWATALGNAFQLLPFTAVIGRSGQVLRIKSGQFSREELSALLSTLLAKDGVQRR